MIARRYNYSRDEHQDQDGKHAVPPRRAMLTFALITPSSITVS